MANTKKINWLSRNLVDEEFPSLSKSITFNGSGVSDFGCGEMVYAIFNFCASDNSELLVLTEVLDTESNDTSRFYVQATNERVLVGHGICKGEFNLEKEKKYRVRFKFYDMNGNSDNKWTNWIKIKNPWNNE